MKESTELEYGKEVPITTKPRKLTVKSKIWVEDENGDVVFGLGHLHILSTVEAH
jgi:hypothetical protein